MAATINYFPFDDGSGANSTEVRWGEMMKHMRTTGVISASTTLSSTGDNAVAPDSLMQIKVYDGEVWMQGFYMQHTGDPYTLIIADNSSGDPRIDLVIVKLDNVGNTIGYAVLEGTPDPSPVPPTLTQTSDEWDLPLAEIAVANGETVIGAGEITDVRVRSTQGDSGSSPYSPSCFVYRDATTTGLTDASTTTIDFDTARLNPDAMWENVTNPERITIGEDGVYLIHALVG